MCAVGQGDERLGTIPYCCHRKQTRGLCDGLKSCESDPCYCSHMPHVGLLAPVAVEIGVGGCRFISIGLRADDSTCWEWYIPHVRQHSWGGIHQHICCLRITWHQTRASCHACACDGSPSSVWSLTLLLPVAHSLENELGTQKSHILTSTPQTLEVTHSGVTCVQKSHALWNRTYTRVHTQKITCPDLYT